MTSGKQSIAALRESVRSLLQDGAIVSLSFKNTRRHSPCLARIEGVYPNFFTVNLLKERCTERISFLYSDLLTGTIRINPSDEERKTQP